MRLFDSGRAPNPRRVRIFLAEKGLEVPTEQVDITTLQHKTPEFTALNPLQRVPVLELDDGTVISESVAICRYFEGLRPEPPLFGRGAKEEALVEMWNRRLEHNLLATVAAVFRHLHPAMKELEAQVPEWGEANKPRVIEFLAFLDRALRDSLFVCGAHYTIADITGLVAIDFMKPARLAVPEEFVHLRRWHAQVAARPSAGA
ncbi:MAG: glutathione S-transferase [Alphaproteobacteria bacterium]|nr:MAG: glutathione S-transferase [Alphaproteobacteria bacterium]